MDLQKHRSQCNKDDPEENCAQDAPKKDLVLIFFGNPKEFEDHHEDEEIVDGQRLFDDEAREKLQGGIPGLPVWVETGNGHQLRVVAEFVFAVEIKSEIKKQCQGDPKDTPPGGFPHADGMGFTVKDPQIQGQHG